MFFNYFRSLKGKIKGNTFYWLITVILWCVGLFIAFVVLFKFAESVGWEESVWQAWQTFTTVGYGNAPAVTTLGRIITMVFSTLGIAFVGALFAAAFDFKTSISEQIKNGLMNNPHKNGYVIFNFPSANVVSRLISEWRMVEPEVPICIVDSKLEELPKSIAMLPNMHYVNGNTLDRSTYLRANLKENKAVIVFPLENNVPDSDGATKTIVELVELFVEESTRIIHILVDSKNGWMFQNSRSKSIDADLEILAVVQESQDEHSSTIVEELLLNTKGANPQTFYPEKIVGWTWGELQKKTVEVSSAQNLRCNLFAIVKNSVPDSCPKQETKIEKGDALSFIAYEEFSWEKFEESLVEVNL
jgi:voltage-gated potassium channel